MSKMKTIAVTGTIGSGKSLASYFLSKYYPMISCDQINSYLIEKNQKVKDAFPNCYPNQELDKKILANIIFNDPIKKKQLEDLMHPLILEEIFKWLKKQNSDFCFIEVPLLFEVGWQKYFDYSLLVCADQEQIIYRLENDRNMTLEEIMERLNTQYNVETKKCLADFIIENNADIDHLIQEVDLFVKYLRESVL